MQWLDIKSAGVMIRGIMLESELDVFDRFCAARGWAGVRGG